MSHHHKSSHRKRSREEYDSDDEPSPSSKAKTSKTDYKEMYRDLREQYKAKKRRIEDLEERLDHEKKETNKAKVDTQELWKIYYTLQKEVTDAYEKCSRLNAEKSKITKELQETKHADAVTGDSNSLKQALLNMQRDKQELQHKFNDIVIENKKLREKAVTYEPKIREMDKIKESIQNASTLATELREQLSNHKKDLAQAKIGKEEVDGLRRWNSLLMMESEQKETKLSNLSDSEATLNHYKCAISMMKVKSRERADLVKQLKQAAEKKDATVAACMTAAAHTLRQLRMDWTWSGQAAKSDLNKVNTLLSTFANKILQFQDKIGCGPKTEAALESGPSVVPDSSNNGKMEGEEGVGSDSDKHIPLLLEQSCEVSQSQLSLDEDAACTNAINNTVHSEDHDQVPQAPASMYVE